MKSLRWNAGRLVLAAALALVLPETAGAQYIEPEEGLPPSPRFVSAGAAWWSFSPLESNSAPDSSRIGFDRAGPVLSYRDGQLDLVVAYTRYEHGTESSPAIYFGGRFGQEIVLAGRPAAAFTIPVSLLLEFTKVEASGPSRQTFNVGAVGLGGGLKYRLSSRTLQLWVEGGGSAAFAFDSYSMRNGFCGGAYAEAAVLFGNVGPFTGIALSYRLRLMSWSMSDQTQNYRALVHGPTVGVVF
jgi:hypothetical protein